MPSGLDEVVRRSCEEVGGDATRLLDVARAVDSALGCVSPQNQDRIAAALAIPRGRVESLVTFYSFLSDRPKGRIVIRLCDDVIDRMFGYERVRDAMCDELGVPLGGTTPDGLITIERTACIGMSDQPPAALVNDVVVRRLTTDRAREIVRELRDHGDPSQLVVELGDGNNAHDLVQSMVRNNLRKAGPIIFSPTHRGEAIRKALVMSPAEVIRAIKTARLRGRGGAGFPCGMKWEFTRAAAGSRKFVVCNADEGEPGTFKDRVVLTEIPDRVIAGMTIAAYAIGAAEGIVYLRAEYAYLRRFLEDVLERRRADNLLGRSIAGKAGFHFDIRIQMGAGAYVCGEETALLSSCEGLRGDPKTRPPFPAEKGYLGCPTSVNNVETLCGVTKIMEEGPATFASYGSPGCTGTKLLSVCGDCRQPGVYEVPMGTKLIEVLHLAGAENAAAVQVGGPSGQMVGPAEFHRTISYDDLGTGGSVMVFGPRRDLLEVVRSFLAFFAEESCGTCTPCRVGNVLLLRGVDRVLAGRGEPADLAEFERIARTMKAASRCGLGQTSSNPVTSTLRNFRPVWESRLRTPEHGDRASFDLGAATACARGLREAAAAGRHEVHP